MALLLLASACAHGPSLDLREPDDAASVATRRPTFRWVAEPAVARGPVTLEVCGDARCDQILYARTLVGDAAAPEVDLPPGALFWRVRAQRGRRALASDVGRFRIP